MKPLSKLLVISVFITGCAPLSQAPLVYNSKIIFGARISASNPQTPGVDLNVGFTTEDTAFIPVAVSKLPEKWGGDEGTASIDLIKGSSGLINPASIEIAAAKVHEAEKTRLEKMKTFRDIESKSNEFKKQARELNTEINSFDKTSPEFNSKNKELGKNLKNIKDDLIENDNKLANAKIDWDTAESNVKSAKAELEKVEGKSDAYSVFGSFDSKSSVNENAKAGISLGRVFSTGVAAQNMSEGLKQSYSHLAIAACLDSLKSIISDKPSTEIVAKICGKSN